MRHSMVLQAEAIRTDLLSLEEAQDIAARRCAGKEDKFFLMHTSQPGQCCKGPIRAHACRGLVLVARTLGPFYSITMRDRSAEGPVLAVSQGFTIPAMGLMHCDSLQIFTRGCGLTLMQMPVALGSNLCIGQQLTALLPSPKQRQACGQVEVPALVCWHMHFIMGLLCRVRGSEGERLRGGVLGLGLLMGGAVFAFGHSCGCKRAEILAIKDDGGCSLSDDKEWWEVCCFRVVMHTASR